MADDDGRADFGGEAEGLGDMFDGGFSFTAVGCGWGIEFRVWAHGAGWEGAEVVDADDGDGVGFDHLEEAWEEFGAEVVSDFDAGETEGEDFLDHGAAVGVAVGVPTGTEGEGCSRHGAGDCLTREACGCKGVVG